MHVNLIICHKVLVYLQESGSVFRQVEQDGRFSRLGGAAWSVCVGHWVSDT